MLMHGLHARKDIKMSAVETERIANPTNAFVISKLIVKPLQMSFEMCNASIEMKFHTVFSSGNSRISAKPLGKRPILRIIPHSGRLAITNTAFARFNQGVMQRESSF